MARPSTGEQSGEYVNGRNGAGAQAAARSPEVVPDTSETRRQIAVMALTGNVNDAQTLYLATPGASLEGWAYVERCVVALRSYVLDGDPTYLRPLSVAQYSGVITPEGDCAEDVRPPELRSAGRAALKAKIQKSEMTGEPNGHV